MENYRFHLGASTINHADTLERDQVGKALRNKQVNTVNKIKTSKSPWRDVVAALLKATSHAIKSSGRRLRGDTRHVCAEKQHLIGAVAHRIPHHDTLELRLRSDPT